MASTDPIVYIDKGQSSLEHASGRRGAYRLGQVTIKCRLTEKAPSGGCKALLKYPGKGGRKEEPVEIDENEREKQVTATLVTTTRVKETITIEPDGTGANCRTAGRLKKLRYPSKISVTLRPPKASLEKLPDSMLAPAPNAEKAYQIGSTTLSCTLDYPAPEAPDKIKLKLTGSALKDGNEVPFPDMNRDDETVEVDDVGLAQTGDIQLALQDTSFPCEIDSKSGAQEIEVRPPTAVCTPIPREREVPNARGIYRVGKAEVECKLDYANPFDDDIALKFKASEAIDETSFTIPSNAAVSDPIELVLKKNGSIELASDDENRCKVGKENTEYEIEVQAPRLQIDDGHDGKVVPGKSNVYQVGEATLTVRLTYASDEEVGFDIHSDALEGSPVSDTIDAGETEKEVTVTLKDTGGDTLSVELKKTDTAHTHFDIDADKESFQIRTALPTLSLSSEVKEMDVVRASSPSEEDKVVKFIVTVSADYRPQGDMLFEFDLKSSFLEGGKASCKFEKTGPDNEFTVAGDAHQESRLNLTDTVTEFFIDLAGHKDPGLSQSAQKHFTVELADVTGCRVDTARATRQFQIDLRARLRIKEIKGLKVDNATPIHEAEDTTTEIKVKSARIIDMELDNAAGFDQDKVVLVEKNDRDDPSYTFMIGQVQEQKHWIIDYSKWDDENDDAMDESGGRTDFRNWQVWILDPDESKETTSETPLAIRRRMKTDTRMIIEVEEVDKLEEDVSFVLNPNHSWIRFISDDDDRCYYAEGRLAEIDGPNLTVTVACKGTDDDDPYKKVNKWTVSALKCVHETTVVKSTTVNDTEAELELAEGSPDIEVGHWMIIAKKGRPRNRVYILGEVKATKKRRIQVHHKHGDDEAKKEWDLKVYGEGSEEYDAPFFPNDRLHLTVECVPVHGTEEFTLVGIINGRKIGTWQNDDYKVASSVTEKTVTLQLDQPGFQALTEEKQLEIRILPKDTARGLNFHEDRLTEDEREKRKVKVRPYPAVTFDEDQPILDSRDKTIEDPDKPDECYHYTVVAEKQTLKIKLAEPMYQQFACFKIDSPDGAKGGRKRMIERGQSRRGYFVPGAEDGELIKKCEVTFGNRARHKPTPKPIQLTASVFANSTSDVIQAPGELYKKLLRVKFSQKQMPALFIKEEGLSHGRDFWVAKDDQVWFQIFREGTQKTPLADIDDTGGVKLVCTAFEPPETPISFTGTEKTSQLVYSPPDSPPSSHTDEMGMTVKSIGRHEAFIALRGDAAKQYHVVRQQASEGDQDRVFRRRRVNQKVILHVEEKRIAYFPMDTIAALRGAAPGDEVPISVRLNIPSDLYGQVTVYGPDCFVTSPVIRFGFGQFEGLATVQMKPAGVYRRLDVELREPKGRIHLASHLNTPELRGKYPVDRFPDTIRRIFAWLDAEEPLVGVAPHGRLGRMLAIKPDNLFKIHFSACLPLPLRFDPAITEKRQLILDCPKLFEPADPGQTPDIYPHFTIERKPPDPIDSAYYIHVDHVKEEVQYPPSTVGAEYIELAGGKPAYWVMAMNPNVTRAVPDSPSDGDIWVRKDDTDKKWKYYAYDQSDDEWQNLDEVIEDDTCIIDGKYKICTDIGDDTSEPAWTPDEDAQDVSDNDICMVWLSDEIRQWTGSRWTTLLEDLEEGTYVYVDADDPDSFYYSRWDDADYKVEVQDGDRCIIAGETEYRKWDAAAKTWLPDGPINDNDIFFNQNTKQYWKYSGSQWEPAGSPEKKHCLIIDGKYQEWDGSDWQEKGPVEDQDIIIDLSQGYEKRFNYESSGPDYDPAAWNEIAAPSNIEVPVSMSAERFEKGTIHLHAGPNSGLECIDSAGEGRKRVRVHLKTRRPLVDFSRRTEGWLEPQLDTFAVGDHALVYLKFSREVFGDTSGSPPKKVKGILDGSIPPATPGRSGQLYIAKDGGAYKYFQYQKSSKSWVVDNALSDGATIIDLSKGKDGRYRYSAADGSFIPVQGVTVRAAFITGTGDNPKKGQAPVTLGTPAEETPPPRSDIGFAEIQFTPQRGGLFHLGSVRRFVKGMLSLASDSACEATGETQPLAVVDRRIVRIKKDSIPRVSARLKNETIELSIYLSLPAPRYGARVEVKGDHIETVPVNEPGYALCRSEDNIAAIPQGEREARVRIKIADSAPDDTNDPGITLSLGKVEATEAKENGYCTPDGTFEPQIWVGLPKLRVRKDDSGEVTYPGFGTFKPLPQGKAGDTVQLGVHLDRDTPAPPNMTATFKSTASSAAFAEKSVTVPADATFFTTSLKLTGDIFDDETKRKVELTLKAGSPPPSKTYDLHIDTEQALLVINAELNGNAGSADKPGVDFKTDEIKFTEAHCGDTLKLALKHNPALAEKPDITECLVRSSAFGGKAYHVSIQETQEPTPTLEAVVTVPGDHHIYICALANPRLKIDSRQAFTITVVPSETDSVVECPDQSARTTGGAVAVSRAIQPEKELPVCNLHSMTLKLTRGGEPVERGDNDGEFYVTRHEVLVQDRTDKPLLCRGRYPVLQVISGSDKDMPHINDPDKEKRDKDREFHETHLEITLNQPEGYDVCQRGVQYTGIQRLVTHPMLILQERFRRMGTAQKEIKRIPNLLYYRNEALNSPRYLKPCTDGDHKSDVARKQRGTLIATRQVAKTRGQWHAYTPDPTRETLDHVREQPDDPIPPVSLRLHRALYPLIPFGKGVQQIHVQAQACGIPAEASPGDEVGPVRRLDAVVEVYPSTEWAVKIGGAPDSSCHSLGHIGKFFDPNQGFDPSTGFDPGLREGLRAVPKAGESGGPSTAPPETPYTHADFMQFKEVHFEPTQPVDSANELESPEYPHIADHTSFYNSISKSDWDEEVEGLEPDDSPYLFYPIDDYESAFVDFPDKVSDALPGGIEFDPFIFGGDSPLLSYEGGIDASDVNNSDAEEDGRFTSLSDVGEDWGGFQSFAKDTGAMFGGRNSDGDYLNETEYAEAWLGAAGLVGFVRDIRFGKNGQLHPASEVLQTILSILSAIQAIAQFILSFVNNAEFKWGWGFGVGINVSYFNGELVHYKGWKECQDARVFHWQYWAINCRLLHIEVEATFGIGISFGGVGASAMLFLSLGLDMLINAKTETVAPDKRRAGDDDFLKLDFDVTGQGGAKAVLVHENVLSLAGSLQIGVKIRFKVEADFQIELYNTGVSLNLELRALVFTRTFTFWVIKPDTDDLPLLASGHWLPWDKFDPKHFRAEDSPQARSYIHSFFEKAEVMIKKETLRRAGYVRMYQILKLNMYMVGGRPPRTDNLPGHRPASPSQAWRDNRRKWDLQWREVKDAFEEEGDRTIKGRGVLHKHSIRNRLKDRADKLDRMEALMGRNLRDLDRLRVNYTRHADAFNKIRESKKTISTTVLARHIREAHDLFKRAREITVRPLTSGSGIRFTRAHRRRRQNSLFQSWLKDMHYYALRRRAW